MSTTSCSGRSGSTESLDEGSSVVDSDASSEDDGVSISSAYVRDAPVLRRRSAGSWDGAGDGAGGHEGGGASGGGAELPVHSAAELLQRARAVAKSKSWRDSFAVADRAYRDAILKAAR